MYTFDVAARRTGKIYNAVGFDKKVTMKDLVESCIPKEGEKPADLKITWVEDQFLQDQGVRQWMELPLWIVGGGDYYLNALAIEDGHTFSPPYS